MPDIYTLCFALVVAAVTAAVWDATSGAVEARKARWGGCTDPSCPIRGTLRTRH